MEKRCKGYEKAKKKRKGSKIMVRTRNADKIRKRNIERKNNYVYEKIAYIDNILYENPRIRNAYAEYKQECLLN